MKEHRSEEPPVLASGNERPEHRAEAEQEVSVLTEETADKLHDEPDDDVDGEEQPGYDDIAVGAGQGGSYAEACLIVFTLSVVVLEPVHCPSLAAVRQHADSGVVLSR